MRKWLDKAWAKAAAFVLTLVLGGLTVLGGIGIGILVSYNVFLDDGAYLRQTLYQEQCYDSLSMANDYLCAQLDSVGLLDKSYYFVNTDAADSAEYNPEAAKQLLSTCRKARVLPPFRSPSLLPFWRKAVKPPATPIWSAHGC